MGISRIAGLIALCLTFISVVGCYEEKVAKAVSELKLGMNRTELEQTFRHAKLMKKQAVAMYPNATEERMRATLWNNKTYKKLHPQDLIDQLRFDGSQEVFCYLIHREKVFANPSIINYVAVFWDRRQDKVFGWAHMEAMGEIGDWKDQF